MTWQATPGSFTDQWLPLQAHYFPTWEQRVSVLRRGLITLTVMLSLFKLGGRKIIKVPKNEPFISELFFCFVSLLVCCVLKLCIGLIPPHIVVSYTQSLLVLVVSLHLSVSHCPCFVQQLHPVPFNKINPNRKHSEEINSGLQRLGHPFGLTAAAKTQCL